MACEGCLHSVSRCGIWLSYGVVHGAQVVLLQSNASVQAAPLCPADARNTRVSPEQLGFISVSSVQACPTKEGLASKCSLAFTSADITAAFAPGEPLYVGYYPDAAGTGQVCCACFAAMPAVFCTYHAHHCTACTPDGRMTRMRSLP